jgi:hypothetical protein
MTEAKTQRSNCRFVLEQTADGKPRIVVQLYQDTIPILHNVVIGFDLLGGTREEQAKKVVEVMNERVIDVFVSKKETASNQEGALGTEPTSN